MSQNLNAQSGPVTIHGVIDKPETKIALDELFYDNIDKNDIDLNEAEIDDQFLIVKNHNARRNKGNLILDGTKIFTIELEELPFLPSVRLLDNGQIWPTEVEYYYDNFENLTSQEEAFERVNSPNNISISEDCIQFVIEGEFESEFIPVFNQVVSDLSNLLCCPGSNPVTFTIQPGAVELGSASPLYIGSQIDIQGGCNAIPENPFMAGLLGEHQDEIAIIQINPNEDIWYFGNGPIGNRFDLYSVVLHEFLHGMGLASRILPDGSPDNGGYSPWDQFLELNGIPLLDRIPAPEGADCCFVFEVNDDIDLPDDLLTASTSGRITVAGIPVCVHYDVSPDTALFLNMLSHLDEDCNPMTDSEYVLNSGLSTGEIRDEISEDELFLLQTLGYCTNSEDDIAPSCYVSLVDDAAIVIEGDEEGVFIDIFANDILPTNFVASEIMPDLTCGDASGIIVSSMNDGFHIEGVTPGIYCFCYSVNASLDSCNEFCDQAEICVSVRAGIVDSECDSEECVLNCFGDFEVFYPDPNPINDYLSQLGLETYVFEGQFFNTPDIVEQSNGNTFIQLAAEHVGNQESIFFELSETVPIGCTIKISFDAHCWWSNQLTFFASENGICSNPIGPSSQVFSQNLCPNSSPQNLFYNMGYNSEEIFCVPNIFFISPFFLPYEFEWENTVGDINFITIVNADNPPLVSLLALDNISITSDCSVEIEFADVTPPENLSVCAGQSTELIYNICNMGPGSQSADITFNSNISNNPFGSVSINPFSPFANGPLTIEGLSPGECQAISLVVNLSPDLLIGQEIEVVLEFESEEACNQQDRQISTFITIDGVPPSSEFSVLVECMNDPPTVLFTAFEPNSDQTTYAWDFGDGNTSAVASPTHTYTQDDTFTVTLTVINECGTSTNSEVIDFDCDDNPSATCPCSTEGNGIVLNDPNIDSYSLNQLVIDGVLPDDEFSACLNLNGTLIVDIDYVFAGAQVIMESEAAIEIQPGIKLKIGNTSSLMGCDALWDGVLVRENAELELSDMSSISDAFQAIHLMNGSSLSCQDVSFRRNYIGIYIPPNANGVMNSISFPLPIIRNTFESDGNLLPDAGNSYNLLFDDMSYTGILANDVLMTIGVSGEVISNTFKGMYNGIRAFKSTIICSRSEFADMVSNDNDIETGHGLYNEDSSIFSFLNIFKNTEYGIRGNKSELKSFQDVFDNFKVGVEMVAAPPGGTISVFDSDFSIYSERAIVVFNSPSATIECLSNTIINTLIFDETFQEAISIFDNGSKNGSLLRLEDNIILLGENQAGITLSNVLRAEVNSNSISFTDDLNFESGWSRGFKMSNCAFTELEGNSVFGASLPSSGFETEDSPNQIFCCNSSSDNQVGMKFSGLSCVNTDLNTNNLERSADAGLSLFNTIIGGQEHKGNLWCNGSAASFIGDLQLVPASFFEVDESDGTVDCLILPPANISGCFFDEDAVTPECIEECEFETGEGRSPEFFDLLAANQAFEGEFNETSNWNSGRYLLNSSELLQGQNEEIDLFYAENQNSALQLYNDFQANLESLFELNADLKDQIQILQNDISLILEQINDINFEIIQASTETEKLALINEKNQREFLLKDQYSLLRNLREEIKNGIISSAQDLKSLNFNLPTPNVAATNEKTINNAVLSSIIDPSFLQKVKVLSRIYNIANQCPASGGLAVYKARSLFDYITPGIQNEYTETDNCYQPSENRISLFEDSINIQENTSIEIYPNPNTGTFTVLIEEGIDNGVLTITNMLGERILNYNINTDMKQLDLNINQNPGLYFVTIENNGEIIKNIKLIVQ